MSRDMFALSDRQSLDDSPIEEDEEALQEEDHDIDQFNDDTFGPGAVEDWEEQHDGLAEPTGDPDDLLKESNLAESISKLVIDSDLEDPAIMRAVPSNPPLQAPPRPNPSMWEGPMVFGGIGNPFLSHLEDGRALSGSKDSILPKRPAFGRGEERDLSDRAPPPRSSSPVIGSPPVRTAPIGTPPKHMSHPTSTQQPSILCPTPVHVRAPIHQRFSAPFNERMSPTQLLNVANSSLRAHHFQSGVTQVLNPLLLGTAQQTGRMSPSHFARVPGLMGSPLTAMNTNLLQSRIGQMMPPITGFQPYFSPAATGQLQNIRSSQSMFRADTTHLHPQHRRLLNQRLQLQNSRNQHRGQNGSGGDRHSRGSYHEQAKKDPYSNLMTQREKEWVSKIQMMQLQSADPYLDDYYYQNYFERLEKKQAALDLNNEGPRKEKKERMKLITPQVAKLEHIYRPVQFEGSLGKLTVSSVNNPRKMIDAVVTPRSDDDETKEKQVRDKRRQTLFTIERTYSLVLEVQDLEKKFLQVSEEERPAVLEHRKAKIALMYENLRGKQLPSSDRVSDDHFVQVMCIRKGKRLAAKVLLFLSTEQAANVVLATARNLPYLVKKDSQDEVLPCLTEACSVLVSRLPSSALTELLQQLTGSTPSGQPGNHFPTILQNKFGLTLFYMILSQGERLQSSEASSELMQDNRWTELVFAVIRVLLKVPQVSLAKPSFVPTNLLTLFSHYVDRPTLSLLESKLQLSGKPR
ncbi:protein PAT1 homolog 1 isoform X1 [Hemiscyllium ocellatum]|uniref:protein PAT1 homolog 1 isoform X1 n=3 Tax=Hemiscyllium ocellatum TaxID=170820 RepID=UPI002965EC51|nr:protein PAT1 homolog 1 isoform X1 [Hemiscyllium ocellatum]